MAFCEQCGNSLESDQQFCMNCGAPVARAPEAEVAQAAVMPESGQTAGRSMENIPPQQAAHQEVSAQYAPPAYAQPGFQESFRANAGEQRQQPQGGSGQPYRQPPQGAHAQARPPYQPYPDRGSRVVGIGGFLGALLLFQIPIAGLIIAICWACGATDSKNKQNLARAMLIVWGIAILIVILVSVLIVSLGMAIINPLSDFYKDYSPYEYSPDDFFDNYFDNYFSSVPGLEKNFGSGIHTLYEWAS